MRRRAYNARIDAISGAGRCNCAATYVKTAAPPDPENGSDTVLQKDSAKDGAVRTILYIEDNPVNLGVVVLVIQIKTPYRFISALEPHSGLELAATHKPDLILLDINLPYIDGFEVLKRLKASLDYSPPILAVSASALPKDIEKGINAGFDEYITKPLELELLVETLNKYLSDLAQ